MDGTPDDPLSELGVPRGVEEDDARTRIEAMLAAVRTHLDMDLAFVSEFADGRRYFRHVDARPNVPSLVPGDSDPIGEAYCRAMADGILPELIHDLASLPAARAIRSRHSAQIRAHLSVPIVLGDGRCYGALCCTSATPDPSLTGRDIKVLRVFADMAARHIDAQAKAGRLAGEARARIRSVLSGDVLASVYQPIFNVVRDRIVGYEALSRFHCEPSRPPNVWFNEAEGVGLGTALEALAVRTALRGLPRLAPGQYLAVNVAPGTILSGGIEEMLEGAPLDRIVLEVTEHAMIDHYDVIARNVRPLRDRGLRIAVDDAGAGYASFKHILSLAPDVIKLDVSIIRNIDRDTARFSLGAALLRFAQETGSRLVAEGVETVAELAALRSLGVEYAQGYLLGRPGPLGTHAPHAAEQAAAAASMP